MLNDTKIKALKPKEKRYKVGDGENLYVQVMPSGTKTFIFEFKSKPGGKYKRISLGRYPIVSLLAAREKRLEFQKTLAMGGEPINKAKPTLTSFESIFKLWFENKKQEVSPKQAFTHQRYYERFFLPKFDKEDIKNVTKRQILEALDKLNKEGKFETLDRALNSISQLFRWAAMNDYVEHSPTYAIDKNALFKTPKVKHYAAIFDDKGIKNLIGNIKNYDGDVRVITAGLFGLLTAQRPFNVRSAKWKEISFDDKIWIIPSGKMKMKEEHRVPLSTQVIRLLENFKKYRFNSEFLFPSIKSVKRPLSDNSVRAMLRNLGYTSDDIVPHGFRAMFSTICHENLSEHGQSERIIEMCLDHNERNKVKAAYNHAINLRERRLLMQWWADYLSRLDPDL